MKNRIILVLFGVCIMRADTIVISGNDTMQPVRNEPLHIYGGLLTQKDIIKNILEIVKEDIERSKQFVFDVFPTLVPKHKKDIATLFEQGYPLVLFVDELPVKEGLGIEWRLYDATQVEMVKGKKQELPPVTRAQQAHAVSCAVWKELLGGQDGPFITRIAYIKRGKNRLGNRISHICTSDWLGKDEHVLLTSQRILVAPTWHMHNDEEHLFFSEFTPSNVRCMRLDKKGTKIPFFDLDGTCVGISCHNNNNTAIYCRSGALWKYTYDEEKKRGVHKRIIYKEQPCTHPTVLNTGDIIFCSGGVIYYWDDAHAITRALTKEGYCVAPDIYPQEGKIVYSQRVKGVMQIMVLDMESGIIEQLTYDDADKVDPRWSPCGHYIVCCCEKGRGSRIAIIHRDTRAFYYLTSASDHCSYPSWSLFGSFW